MSKYNYQYQRPRIDQAASENLMDFEHILSRVYQTKRYHLIRNTALITLTISACIFSLIYFNRSEKLAGTQSNDTLTGHNANKQVIEDKPTPPQGNEQNIRPIIPGSKKKATEETAEMSKKEIIAEHSIPNDHFKIKETMPEKPAFVQAEPKEGFQQLFKYFNENTPYPDSLKSKKITGKVLVEFTILKNGEIGDVKVVQKLHPVLDSIAVASVMQMPAWKPATMNNMPVESSHTIPLFFQLNNQ